jgi:hypothetical protein
MREKIKFILLFAFGIALAILTIFLGISWQQQTSQPKKHEVKHLSLTPLSSQKRTAVASMSLSPSQLTVYQNEEVKIRVLIESKAKIVGADLSLAFEPNILAIKQIKPGSFFSQPQEIKKIIEAKKGTIFYSLGSFSPQAGQGVLAEFIFKAKKPGITQISLAKETQVAAEGTNEVKITLPLLGKYTILRTGE